MGLAASQARILFLIAWQSDLEFQIQNICQKRTVLASEIMQLNNYSSNTSTTATLSEVKTSFESIDELIDYIDTNDDGVMSESEIETVQNTFKNAGIKNVEINGENYNLVMGNDKKKVKGTKKKDLILATNVKKVKAKGGDDIIITYNVKKVNGGRGKDIKKNSNALSEDEIENKLTILQTKDKILEMQQKNLETKQKAVSTENESVQKIIENNIKRSFAALKN